MFSLIPILTLLTLQSTSLPAQNEDRKTLLTCEPTNMSFLISVENGTELEFMKMDSTGKITSQLFTALTDNPPTFALDPRGCLLMNNEAAIIVTFDSKIWTPRQYLTVTNNTLSIPDGPTFHISPTGVVTTTTPHSTTPQPANIRFHPYSPHFQCAAFVMLTSFLAMTPSMAISDGNPPLLDPPKNSPCPLNHPK